ncbi:MAG: hypothetical protein RJB17_1535 [Pseudomonadota bacterium]|jgi:hypothetical protein
MQLSLLGPGTLSMWEFVVNQKLKTHGFLRIIKGFAGFDVLYVTSV